MLARALITFLLFAAGSAVNLVRVDSLLVARGLCASRAAAKIAIAAGHVTTKSGSVVKKASVALDEDAVLFLLQHAEAMEVAVPPPTDTAKAVAAPAMAAQPPAAAQYKGASTLTAAGEMALQEALHAEKPVRRKSAAARAAEFQNAKRADLPSSTANDNGLMGRRGGKSSGIGSAKPKHYSKKNKPGTAAAAAAALG